MRFYKYRLRKRPINGWYFDENWDWHKPGLTQYFSDNVLREMPGQVDVLDKSIPIFAALLDNGVDLNDFYEDQGRAQTFAIWPPETKDKPDAEKMLDVCKILCASKRRDNGM